MVYNLFYFECGLVGGRKAEMHREQWLRNGGGGGVETGGETIVKNKTTTTTNV
jgi:hypothetical protein